MAKQTRARLDAKGLGKLGLDKLIEILLQEAASNKPLKARLLAALAGTSGPEEIARLIDKRLDAIEKSRSGINSSRARDLADELSGILRNIDAELGAVDRFMAFERLVRLFRLRENVQQRLYSDSARLMKVFGEVDVALDATLAALPEAQQVQAIPQIEAQRAKDRYGESRDFFTALVSRLMPAALDAWRRLLQPLVSDVVHGQYASLLLQAMATAANDLDAFVALEAAKPANRQDSLGTAEKLHAAGRHAEALQWIRKPPPPLRTVQFNGITMGVGPDFDSGDRKLLEADILDAMKDRKAAQQIRWDHFAKTFDPEGLRAYLAALGDFEEFDELDKAFALVMATKHIDAALLFLIEWPRHDLAARLVIQHARKWDGADYEILVPAAQALREDQPLAATVLYRVLLKHILDRSLSSAYNHGAGYLAALAELWPLVQDASGLEDHRTFLTALQAKHGRKYGFWSLVPKDLS